MIAARPHQEGACALGLACGEPVVGREIGRRATGLEETAQLAVKRASLRPVRVRVQRLAHEVMPKRGDAGLDLVEQTAVENLAQAGIAVQGRKQVELDVDADHRGCLEGGSSLVRKAVGADAERVAKRFRDRDARPVLELEAVRTGHESRPCFQRGRQLLHEERHPLSAVVQGSAERWARLAVEELRSETSGRCRVEWLYAELGEASRATEVRRGACAAGGRAGSPRCGRRRARGAATPRRLLRGTAATPELPHPPSGGHPGRQPSPAALRSSRMRIARPRPRSRGR